MGSTRTKRRNMTIGARNTNGARLWRRPNSDIRVVSGLCRAAVFSRSSPLFIASPFSITPVSSDRRSVQHANAGRRLGQHLRSGFGDEKGVLDARGEAFAIDAGLD